MGPQPIKVTAESLRQDGQHEDAPDVHSGPASVQIGQISKMGAEQIENMGACRQLEVEGLQSKQNGRDVVEAVEIDLDLSNGGLS